MPGRAPSIPKPSQPPSTGVRVRLTHRLVARSATARHARCWAAHAGGRRARDAPAMGRELRALPGPARAVGRSENRCSIPICTSIAWETAAHLTDQLQVRERLRYFLGATRGAWWERDADLQGTHCTCSCASVESGLRAHRPGSARSRLGAVAFIHRFGSTLNAHLHSHCPALEIYKSAEHSVLGRLDPSNNQV